jgi:FlaA1/EpsC-like NDP-sugar epimerase
MTLKTVCFQYFKKTLSFIIHLQKKIAYQNSYKNLVVAYKSLKTSLFFVHDVAMAFFALFISLYFKIGDEFLDYSSVFLAKNFFVFLLIFIGVFVMTQPYRTAWNFINIEDFAKIGLTAILTNLLYMPAMFLLANDEAFSAIIPIINIFVLTTFLSVPRLIAKTTHEHKLLKMHGKQQLSSILLIGESTNVEHFITEIPHIPSFPYKAVGIVITDNEASLHQTIHDIPILGMPDNAENIFQTLDDEQIKLAYIVIVDESFDQKNHKAFITKAQEKKIIVLKTMHKLSFNIIAVDN